MLLQVDYVYHLHGVKQNLPNTGISCHLSVFKDSLIISWHKDIFKDSLIIFWYKDIFLLPQKKDFFPPPTCVHAVPINYRMSEWLCVAQSGPTEKLSNWKSRQMHLCSSPFSWNGVASGRRPDPTQASQTATQSTSPHAWVVVFDKVDKVLF